MQRSEEVNDETLMGVDDALFDNSPDGENDVKVVDGSLYDDLDDALASPVVIEVTLAQQLNFNGGWFEKNDIIEVTEGQLSILDAMGVKYN